MKAEAIDFGHKFEAKILTTFHSVDELVVMWHKLNLSQKDVVECAEKQCGERVIETGDIKFDESSLWAAIDMILRTIGVDPKKHFKVGRGE